MMKDKISQWYRQGLWTEKMVHDAVNKGVLTEAEYREIVETVPNGKANQ